MTFLDVLSGSARINEAALCPCRCAFSIRFEKASTSIASVNWASIVSSSMKSTSPGRFGFDKSVISEKGLFNGELLWTFLTCIP